MMNPIILLLDDSEENLVLLQRMLEGLPGVEAGTVCFTAAAKALDWCRQHEPDICVVDFHMPGMDGVAFITEARKLPGFKGIPMVMVTGAAESEVRRRALASGATDFLTRPVEPEEIRARLHNLLSLRLSLVNPPSKIAGSEERYKDVPVTEPRMQECARDGAVTEPRMQIGRRSEATPAASDTGARGEPQGGGEQRVERLAHDVELLARQTLEREHELIISKLSHLSTTRDEETGNHMHRVAHIARLIAAGLGHDTSFCDMIYLAAPMHDIGKVGIPDKILLKPGKLTAEEWEIMKTHTTIGYEVLKDSSSPLLRMGADIAHSHHEKFNGQGYPLGLMGEKIPIVGRIVSVADELDALLSVRPYKQAWNLKDALEQMQRERGRHFDPGCIDVMLRHVDAILEIQQQFADETLSAASETRPKWRGVA